jgi:hypothetical protein
LERTRSGKANGRFRNLKQLEAGLEACRCAQRSPHCGNPL